jgi:hypothetical protein
MTVWTQRVLYGLIAKDSSLRINEVGRKRERKTYPLTTLGKAQERSDGIHRDKTRAMRRITGYFSSSMKANSPAFSSVDLFTSCSFLVAACSTAHVLFSMTPLTVCVVDLVDVVPFSPDRSEVD